MSLKRPAQDDHDHTSASSDDELLVGARHKRAAARSSLRGLELDAVDSASTDDSDFAQPRHVGRKKHGTSRTKQLSTSGAEELVRLVMDHRPMFADTSAPMALWDAAVGSGHPLACHERWKRETPVLRELLATYHAQRADLVLAVVEQARFCEAPALNICRSDPATDDM